MARRFVQSAVAVVLAALVIFGAAGIASAAFTSKSTASLAVSTLTLQPPTAVAGACNSILFGVYKRPIVSFGVSSSENAVKGRPSSTQVLAYSVHYQSYTTRGTPDANGTDILAAGSTQWSGAEAFLQSPRTWTVTIATTYGTWTSAPTAVSFTC